MTFFLKKKVVNRHKKGIKGELKIIKGDTL